MAIIKLVLPLLPALHGADQKRFYFTDREIHRQHPAPVTGEIQRYRSGDHLLFQLRVIVRKGLPDNAPPRIIPLALSGKPEGADGLRIVGHHLRLVPQRQGRGEKAAARDILHPLGEIAVMLRQIQQIPQLQRRHQLISRERIVLQQYRVVTDDAPRDAKHRQRTTIRQRYSPGLLGTLAQIALTGATQYVDIERLLKGRLHAVAKKHHPVNIELQQPIHFMGDISQIIALVGHIGLFQNVDFTPDQ